MNSGWPAVVPRVIGVSREESGADDWSLSAIAVFQASASGANPSSLFLETKRRIEHELHPVG
jgi:hypothetical protein